MFKMKLAGFTFLVDNQFGYVADLCQDYSVDSKEDFSISVTEEEREFENQDGGNWPAWYLESLAIYRKICEKLVSSNILLFHCSALSLDGKAVLFTGPSGTGKSTHARLWREHFKNKVITINDDKPLLSFEKDHITVWGTPYGGKDNLQTNTKAMVQAIVVLKQAKENRIRKMTPHEAFPYLIRQTYRSRNTADMIHTLDLVQELSLLPVYELSCTISMEAVELCYDTVFRKEL